MTENPERTTYFVSIQTECMILPLWAAGQNTNLIAIALGLPEFEIANRLPKILEQRRGAEEGKMRGQIWTPDHEEELRSLYAKGYSAAMIAAKMACGFTRNAIIGKVHRLKLERRGTGKHPKIEIKRPPRILSGRVPSIRVTPGRARPAPMIQAAEEIRCAEVVPLNVSLMDRDPDGCCYPYGDGPFTFCGNLKAAGSYCAAHDRLTRIATRSALSPAERVLSRRKYMTTYRATKRAELEAAI